MKKIFFTIISFIGGVVLIGVPYSVSAVDITPFNKPSGMKSPIDNPNQIWDLVITGVKWLYTIFFVVTIFYILLAAYNFVTSKGEEKKVKAAQDQLKYAAIAVVVALLASGFAYIIKSFLENPNL